MQCDLSWLDSLPGAQTKHSTCPSWVLNLPGPHLAQERGHGAPPSYDWKEPMPQSWHCRSPSLKYCPPLQPTLGTGVGEGVGEAVGVSEGSGVGAAEGRDVGKGISSDGFEVGTLVVDGASVGSGVGSMRSAKSCST